ncbi:MAG: uracil-DNA glycosylase [Pseudomonadota bacterium]
MTRFAPTDDCALCPRLVDFRHDINARHPDWHNAPVPAFGPKDAGLLVVGLAPGLKGANRTGRPFTGDGAGDLLYATLIKSGFAKGDYQKRPDDGLQLVNCRITNAVRCVPPQNKPIGGEISACNDFLTREMEAMPKLRVILALGGISHNAVLRALGHKQSRFRFGHAADHDLGDGKSLVDSYHCSRLNTNTGRLTPAMFEAVFAQIQQRL